MLLGVGQQINIFLTQCSLMLLFYVKNGISFFEALTVEKEMIMRGSVSEQTENVMML